MSEVKEASDAVVVGGGIVGVCVALQLQRSGHEVTLIERDVLGNEASGHNGGVFSIDCMPTGLPSVIRSLPRMLRDPMSPLIIRWRHLPGLSPWLVRFAFASRAKRVESISIALNSLMSRGIESYRPLVEGTEAEEIFDNHGFLYCYRNEKSSDGDRFPRELRSRRGIEYQVLDGEAIGALSPVLAGRFKRALHFESALFTRDPRTFTQALADRFVADGGKVRQAEVTGFEMRGHRVHKVLTGNGAVAANTVVIAAGPWSRHLLRQLGTNVPLDVERGYGMDLPNPGIKVDMPTILADLHVGVSPHRGGIRLTGLDELAGVNAPANLDLAARVARSAKLVFPELRTEGGVPWMRARPSMPDSLPVISRAPAHENVYLAFGHGHKGLCMGAITGKLVQELVDGHEPTVDLAPYRSTRFSARARVSETRT